MSGGPHLWGRTELRGGRAQSGHTAGTSDGGEADIGDIFWNHKEIPLYVV